MVVANLVPAHAILLECPCLPLQPEKFLHDLDLSHCVDFFDLLLLVLEEGGLSVESALKEVDVLDALLGTEQCLLDMLSGGLVV